MYSHSRVRAALRGIAPPATGGVAPPATAAGPHVPRAAELAAAAAASAGSPSQQVASVLYTRLVYIAFLLQIKLLGALLPFPALGVAATLLLSALVHSYDCFEACWGQQGKDVQVLAPLPHEDAHGGCTPPAPHPHLDLHGGCTPLSLPPHHGDSRAQSRFRLIEDHWLFFLGYGVVLATLSVRARCWRSGQDGPRFLGCSRPGLTCGRSSEERRGLRLPWARVVCHRGCRLEAGPGRIERRPTLPPSVCHLQVVLRFWDLFVIRAVLYPLYIANAPHARFEALRCRPLPVFRLAFGVINGGLQLAELKTRAGAGR